MPSPSAVAAGCATIAPHRGPFSLRVDLLGYTPGDPRRGVILGDGTPLPRWRLCELATGRFVSEPTTAGPRALDVRTLTGARMTGHAIDLSGARALGRYAVVLEGAGTLGSFGVARDPYAPVTPALLAFLRAQRCGATRMDLSGHGACHRFASIGDGDERTSSGDGISVPDGFRGAISASTGPAVDVEGGWHDAGDYVKFLGTTAFVVTLDLLALRDHPRALAPHASAMLDELGWATDWIERMVAGPAPFHQVSGLLDHELPPRRPEDDTATPIRDDDGVAWQHRPAFRIDLAHLRGGNVLGRAVAALALWSMVAPTVRPDDAAVRASAGRRLALARRLYDLAVTLPRPQPSDPPDFYPEDSVDDDLALAAAVLASVTAEDRYRADALARLDRWLSPDNALAPEASVYWGDVTALALAEAIRGAALTAPARDHLRALLAALVAPVAATREHPTGPAAIFDYALPSLGNGSVALLLGSAVACLVAESAGAATGCRDVALAQVHWVLGRNPFGVTFVAGIGARSPRRLHHDLTRVAGEPVSGAVVGGPASLRVRARSGLSGYDRASEFVRFSTPDVFYQDSPDDYVVNEPAVDFTPALLYVLAALDGGT